MLTETRSLVCVIDDDAMVRESICLLLDMLGLQCTAFADCRSFLDSPTLPHCECLILDVRMPGISGTVLQEILKDKAPHLPIIFISCSAERCAAATCTGASQTTEAMTGTATFTFTLTANWVSGATVRWDLNVGTGLLSAWVYQSRIAVTTAQCPAGRYHCISGLGTSYGTTCPDGTTARMATAAPSATGTRSGYATMP